MIPPMTTTSAHTPRRSIRVGVDLWNAAKARAEERGETVTDVIVRALTRYTKDKR